ncbi:I78 family peptidase inhibitor [Sphingomonas sp.]|uniref:I78 family peptidase inhibitor n=1 Tax=Sphingomonas sp. TaxID=28214 RepID=UPI0025E69F72|nr:I78 family peptidase inhibitor [Sphingomonas sp.]
MRNLVASIALLPLAACQIAQSDGTAPGPLPGTCRAAALDQFIGQPASTELGVNMLKASGARVIRWVPKGGAVTMDFRGDRITVALDDDNKVERASCG